MSDRKGMGDLLKRRMTESQQASELAASNQAYEKIFRQSAPAVSPLLTNLALSKLVPFFTEDIGFKPYSPEKLKALAGQLQEDGLLARIVVRKTPDGDRYEILAGHNRANAAKLAGRTEIPAEAAEADDARAIVIAASANPIQRQNLSIVERGKARKALLEAKNRNGQRDAASGTFGDNRQRHNARQLVAEFFNVSEYGIRKAVKLTRLIPELPDSGQRAETTPCCVRQSHSRLWRGFPDGLYSDVFRKRLSSGQGDRTACCQKVSAAGRPR